MALSIFVYSENIKSAISRNTYSLPKPNTKPNTQKHSTFSEGWKILQFTFIIQHTLNFHSSSKPHTIFNPKSLTVRRKNLQLLEKFLTLIASGLYEKWLILKNFQTRKQKVWLIFFRIYYKEIWLNSIKFSTLKKSINRSSKKSKPNAKRLGC